MGDFRSPRSPGKMLRSPPSPHYPGKMYSPRSPGKLKEQCQVLHEDFRKFSIWKSSDNINFQMEFGSETLQLWSTHELFNSWEFQLQTPPRSWWTRINMIILEIFLFVTKNISCTCGTWHCPLTGLHAPLGNLGCVSVWAITFEHAETLTVRILEVISIWLWIQSWTLFLIGFSKP